MQPEFLPVQSWPDKSDALPLDRNDFIRVVIALYRFLLGIILRKTGTRFSGPCSSIRLSRMIRQKHTLGLDPSGVERLGEETVRQLIDESATGRKTGIRLIALRSYRRIRQNSGVIPTTR
jgi:hypothetical protein